MSYLGLCPKPPGRTPAARGRKGIPDSYGLMKEYQVTTRGEMHQPQSRATVGQSSFALASCTEKDSA